MLKKILTVASASVLFAGALTAPAIAHTGVGLSGGLLTGFEHPITGLDHVIAMVAVGLWGAFLGRPAIWILPVVFPLVMAFGSALGVLGVPLPYAETGIALSGLLLGLAVAFAAKPPIYISAILVGVFAIFHGHAHGAELPEAANPFSYALGFVVATGLLHLSGIALGYLAKWPAGKVAVRAGGSAIAIAGLGFLTGFL